MEQWNEYWDRGFITSFGSNFDYNYEGVLLDFWESTFRDMPKAVSILDIGTGNASIPLIGRKVSQSFHLEHRFTGTDLASIDTRFILKQLDSSLCDFPADFDIMPNTSSDSLPFSAQTFDRVTSQYGFEYSNMHATLEQLSKVCKANAEMIFVIHHADSVILKKNNRTRQCLTKILSENGLLSILVKLINAIDKAGNRNGLNAVKDCKKCEKFRAMLNNKSRALEVEFTDSFHDTNIGELVSATFKETLRAPLNKKLEKINNYKLEAKQHFKRLCDLKSAAYTENRLQSLFTEAENMGFEKLSIDQLYDEKSLLAWKVKLKKRALYDS